MEKCTSSIIWNWTKGKTGQSHHYAKKCYLGFGAKSYMTGTLQLWLKYLLMSFMKFNKIFQTQKVS